MKHSGGILKDAFFNLGKKYGYSDEEIEQALKGEGRGGPASQEGPLGFDHNWIVRGYSKGQLNPVALLTHAESGRQM